MNNKKKILVCGGDGFIGTYLCDELLKRGYNIVCVDNHSKYGPVIRPHHKNPNFDLIIGDVKNLETELKHSGRSCNFDYIICLAAKIGGIEFFNAYAADLMCENERIMASAFEFAKSIRNHLKRIIVISSSMVFESTEVFPTPETEINNCRIPLSVYGFQKLACEFWAKGYWKQYGIPYTIIRPFNCVGAYEDDAKDGKEIYSGNVKMMLSHVLPDLVNKCLKGQNPLHILGNGNQIRSYTNGKDIAQGICLSMESDKALNEDFNISTPDSTSVLELAEKVWNKINPDKPFEYSCDEPYEHDVLKRVPDVSKAKALLGFEAKISLDESIDEVIEYFRNKTS